MTAYGEAKRFLHDVALAHTGADCLVWPYARNNKGYAIYRARSAARFVCEAKTGPAPTRKHHAAHSCGNGNGACVSGGHLSWKSPKANEADKRLHGTVMRGAIHPRAHLSEDDVRAIIRIGRTARRRVVAAKYGVTPSLISMIINRKIWTHLNVEGSVQ